MIDYNWLSKRTYRSVDTLRLWSENPRLNPEDSHIYVSDFGVTSKTMCLDIYHFT